MSSRRASLHSDWRGLLCGTTATITAGSVVVLSPPLGGGAQSNQTAPSNLCQLQCQQQKKPEWRSPWSASRTWYLSSTWSLPWVWWQFMYGPFLMWWCELDSCKVEDQRVLQTRGMSSKLWWSIFFFSVEFFIVISSWTYPSLKSWPQRGSNPY